MNSTDNPNANPTPPDHDPPGESDERSAQAEIFVDSHGDVGSRPASLHPGSLHPASLHPVSGDAGLTGTDEPIRRRRVWLPLFLFLTTCVTTFLAGCYHWFPAIIGQNLGAERFVDLVQNNWSDGLIFMVGVMSVLMLHEMGHFVMTIRHKVPSSYPFFLPVPIMITGTMGAVIGMDPYKATRKDLFDIGLAGPLAGLVLTIPLIIWGIMIGTYSVPATHERIIEFGDPLMVTLLIPLLRDLPEGAILHVNPIYMAGWVGMLVTGLNMLPVSQLDGGHVSYALLGRYSKLLGRGFVMAAIAFIVATDSYNWLLMLILVIFIGTDHPPTADDTIDIGWGRRILGFASLAIPIFCFPPVPLSY